MSIHTASYPLSVAAEAVGVSANTLRTWFQRKHFALNDDDRQAPGEGLARNITGRTVLQIGIAAQLIAFGLSPARAFLAAGAFAVIGDNWNGKERFPGQLWGQGALSLLIVPGGEAGPSDLDDVVRWEPRDDFISVFARNNFYKLGGVMLPLDNLVNEIRKRLGLPADKGTLD